MKEGRQETEAVGLHAKLHVNVFIVSPSGGQKPQFWAHFIHDGMQYDTIQGQGHGHKPLKVENSAIFKGYLTL